MSVETINMTPREMETVRDRILYIYGRAFAEPPYSRSESDVEAFSMTLGRHTVRKDFRCCIAREDGRIVGFTYGYTTEPGQWWHDIVARAMDAVTVEEWLTGSFEFVELAVLPEAQGRGIGGRLHDALLEGLPHDKAVLSTHQSETPAFRLYRKRGWTVLVRDVMFPGLTTPYVIMGLDLSKQSPRNPARTTGQNPT